MMDSRDIYAALFDPRGPAGEPKGDWVFVGDALCFDHQKFSDCISQLDVASDYLVAVSRSQAARVEIDSVGATVQKFLQQGEVRIGDPALSSFVQVSVVGVARSWRKNA